MCVLHQKGEGTRPKCPVIWRSHYCSSLCQVFLWKQFVLYKWSEIQLYLFSTSTPPHCCAAPLAPVADHIRFKHWCLPTKSKTVQLPLTSKLLSVLILHLASSDLPALLHYLLVLVMDHQKKRTLQEKTMFASGVFCLWLCEKAQGKFRNIQEQTQGRV